MINRSNFGAVKDFQDYCARVHHLSVDSLARYRAYLRLVLLWLMDVPLAVADRHQPSFPIFLSTWRTPQDKPLSASSLRKIVQVTQALFRFLKQQQAYDARQLSNEWIESLRPPAAHVPEKDHEYVTLESALRIARLEIELTDLTVRRDQAAFCLMYLSGIRIGALSTLTIQAVDLERNEIRQWAELGVKTKFGKAMTSHLLQLPELLTPVRSWDALVRASLPPTAPWCATVEWIHGQHVLTSDPPGKNRRTSLLKRMRLLCQRAGVPYLSPHKCRHGHAVYARQHAKDMTDLMAISRNLGHSHTGVTEAMYARTTDAETKAAIMRLGQATSPTKDGPTQAIAALDGISNELIAELLLESARRLQQAPSSRKS
jgi:integrase